MLNLVQKIAGAGRLVATRFAERVYIDPFGNKRGHGHNRGVDAGCPISVCCFKLGINSDVSLTGLNSNLDWSSVYSDDRSPLTTSGEVLQGALSDSVKWAKKHKILYHDGITCCLNSSKKSKCKKYPALLVYARKGMAIPESFKNIMLDQVKFKTTYFQRCLGLNVYTDPSKEQYK